MHEALTKLNAGCSLSVMSGLTLAIKAAGSQTELARRLGTSVMRVGNWKRRGVPPEEVIPVVRAVRGAVRPYDLRPDIYPDPNWMPPGVEGEEDDETNRIPA